MTVRSTTDQAQALLGRRVAEARVRGSLSPDIEAAAIFESIALNLLFKPRAALWFALLARNGLRQAVQSELDAITALRASIADLSNPALVVRDTRYLNDAKNALTQLEQMDHVSTSSIQFAKFDSSVSNFLNKTISKGVRRIGATALTRPGSEAAQDLLTDFTNLSALHTDVLDRFYSLMVGVNNFMSSPLATIIGLTTISRAKSDFESLIETIEETGSVPADRDMAIRVLTSRAAVKTTGELPNYSDPVLDSVLSLPTGYEVQAVSDPAPATVTSSAGPFTFPAGAAVSVTVNGVTLGPHNIPQTIGDVFNNPILISSALTFPIVIPANYYLFVSINGLSYKIPITAGSLASFSALLVELTAQFAAHASPAVNGLVVVEFINAGTSRILLGTGSATTTGIVQVHADSTGVYTNSVHLLLGYTGFETAVLGTSPIQWIVEALTRHFSSLVTVTMTSGQTFKLETLATAPGTTMTITAPTVLGIAGTYTAQSDTVKLYGVVNGIATDPVSPIGLMNVGDLITVPTGTATVAGLSPTRITMSAAKPTFDGDITVRSVLVSSYSALIAALSPFLTLWLKKSFAKNLSQLNLALNSLTEGSPQSQRSVVVSILDSLEEALEDLLTVLDDTSTIPPASAASEEKDIVNGITNTLAERKFDRALDFFLKCKIQEALNSNADTASFGGAFIKAASDFAQTDLVVPNRSLDQQIEGTSSQDTKGL